MKLLDVMKAYNKAVLRENAKLKNIYNTLIREAQAEGLDVTDTNECDGADGDGQKPVTECDGEGCDKPANECDGKKTDEGQTVGQFFSSLLEGDDKKECCEEGDAVNEGDKLDGKVFDDNLKKEVLPESEEDQEAEKKEEATTAEAPAAEEKPAEAAPAAEAPAEATPDTEAPAETAPADTEATPDAEAPAAEEKPAEAPTAEEKPVEEKKEQVKICSAKEFLDEQEGDVTPAEDNAPAATTDEDETLDESIIEYQKANRRLFS